MKNTRKALSLLLSFAMILSMLTGMIPAQSAKKKTTVKISSVKITNTDRKLRLQKGKKYRLKTTVKSKPNQKNIKKLNSLLQIGRSFWLIQKDF